MTRTAPLRILLVALALFGTTCSVPEDSSPRTLDYSRLPDDLATTPEPIEPTPLVTQKVLLYLIDDNNLLHPTSRDVASPADLRTVLETLLSAPNEAETEQALSTALPAEVKVVSVEPSGDLVTVALESEVFEERLEGETRRLAVAQLVFTATQATGATRFLLRLNDNPVPLPTDSGESEDPVTRDDFRSVDPDQQAEPTATAEPTPVPPTPTPSPEPTPTAVPDPTLPPGFRLDFSNNNDENGG
ncbi:GerMN domain-containing protein [Candidatus Poriferisocius sp.]|uniref:GerMN domain-containing protein n=1 Tax=Candidatus Poriferisocius sp. TaxID=3101276 RepID=UPI003B02DCF6